MENPGIQIEGMVLFQWAVLIVAAGISAAIDLRTRLIPNLITLPLIVSGPIVMGVAYGWSGVLSSLLGLLLLGLPYTVLWMANGGGAGDAKLMMGIGAWVGLEIGIWMLLTTMIAGGVYALIAAGIYGQFRALPYSIMATFMRILSLRRSSAFQSASTSGVMDGESEAVASSDSKWIPYGPVIFIGVTLGGVLWAIYGRD